MSVNYTGNTTSQLSVSILEQLRLDYPRWAYTIIGVMLVLVCVIGVLCDFVILKIFMVNKHLVSPTNIFIIGLFMCDICMASFGIPVAASAAFAGHWVSGRVGCTAEAMITYTLGLTSLYIHTAISIDRYAVISRPIHATAITKRVAIQTVLGCFILGLLFAIMPLLGWNGYGLEVSGISCGLQYADRSLRSSSYIITIFVFCFLLPAIVIAYCYYNLYKTVKGLTLRKTGLSNQFADRNSRIERKMLKTCGAIVVSFWVCWMPYAVVSFWQSFGNVDYIPVTVSLLPATAAKSQLLFNPIIYVATNEQFRAALCRMLPCTSLQKLLTYGEDAYSVSNAEIENKDIKLETIRYGTATCVTRSAIHITHAATTGSACTSSPMTPPVVVVNVFNTITTTV